MRWDPLLASALARELDGRLDRARARALHLDGETRRIHLFLREATLVFEMHPNDGWVTLLDPVEPFQDARSLAARVHGVRALPDESAIVLGLRRLRGKREGLELTLEWSGNRWNAAVVGHRSRVIRHVLVPRRERTRALEVGQAYEPPAGTGRRGAGGTLERSEWEALLEEAGPEPPSRRGAVLRNVAGVSSLNVARYLEPDGWEAWRSSFDPSRWGAFLLDLERGVQPYPIPLPPRPATEYPSILSAMEAARDAARCGPARSLLLPPGILERAERRLARASGRAKALRRELDSARDPGPIRAVGDLILARYGEVPEGAGEVRLRDFEGNEIEVELDPAMAPHENAKRYYDEAARAERARRELPGRIGKAETAAEEWRKLVQELREGTADPVEVRRRLGPERRRRVTGRPGPVLPYRTFRSSGGLEIRVGRGARRNDDLTFHHSSPDDVWMHVRQAPGAHVILRWQGDGAPPRRDLAEAAVLAAVHSEARHSGTVPVDWTRRKYVRKPRGAAPGAVLPDRVETLFVEPDPELPDRLSADPDAP